MKDKITYEQIMAGLNSRASIKNFTPPNLSDKRESDKRKELIDMTKEIIRLSPSSFGLQPYQFLIITDSKILEKLRSHAYDQSQITESHFLVVFCAKTKIDETTVDEYMALVSKTRGIPLDKTTGFKQAIVGALSQFDQQNKINWATSQAYIALGNILTALSLLGVDSCPMEGFDSDGFDSVLSLKDKGLTSVVLLSVGTRDEKDPSHSQAKVRFSKESLFIDYP